MKKIFLVLAVLSWAVVFYGQPALANPLTVLNPSFEDPVITTPGSTSPIVDWSVTGNTNTFRPTAAQFPAGVPDGVNDAAIGPFSGTIFQVLAATLQANTTYTLKVDVGVRADFPFSGYEVELIAATSGDILVADGSLNPAPGTFLTDTLIFNSGPSPVQLGQNLKILLLAPDNSGQVNFDNVRLDAVGPSTAVPIPPAGWLLGSGLLGLIGLRKKFIV